MVDTRVRQQRCHTLDIGNHDSFKAYMTSKGYNENDRAYILDVGVKLTESVNDTFSRLSFPYNKSDNGYALVIIPSEQIMASGNKSNFGEDLCDIDIGDKYKKYTVKYTDKQGNPQQELISTKHIERYLNYTSAAYQYGYTNGYGDNMSDIDKILDDDRSGDYESVELKTAKSNDCLSYYFNKDTYCALYDNWNEFVNTETSEFNYDLFRQKVVSKYDDLVKPENIVSHPFVSALTSSNKSLFLESYTDGINDRFKHNIMAVCYTLYPPEKDSKEYNTMLSSNFNVGNYKTFVSNNERFKQYLENKNQSSRSESFMDIPQSFMDIDDEWSLPFS